MLSFMIARLWSMSFQASVLIVVILLVRLGLRNYKKSYSYFLWFLVLFRLLCPVMIESKWSMQPDFVSKDFIEMPDELESSNTPVQMTNPMVNYTADLNQDAETVDKMDSEITGAIKNTGIVRNDVYTDYLQAFYLAGAFWTFVYFAVQYMRIKRKVVFAIRERGNVWLCEQISSPFVMGVIKPAIYLPFSISSEEKKYILRHERAHIAHHDPFIRLLGTAAVILHWWNPFVWYAIHKMNQDMEMYCDETALKKALLEEKKAYSKILLQFAVKQSGLAMVLSFGESNTEIRIKNVLKKKRNSMLIGGAVILVVLLCTIAFLTIPKNEENLLNTEGVDSEGEQGTLLENTEEIQSLPAKINIYGDWMVNHIAGSTRETALSEEEQSSFREARIGYSQDAYTYYNNHGNFSEHANIVEYKSELVTRDEFAEMFPGTGFSDLAVDMNEMWHITVDLGEDVSRFGDNFFIYGENDIIIQYNDVFFWAQKIDDFGIEMQEGEYYYEVATGFKKTAVEAYASEIRTQILEQDWTGISEKLSYPITIAGVTYQNAEEFLAADMDKYMTEEFMQSIEAETCENMFHNWQGIMMGETGELWFAEILNDDSGSQGLKIIAINIPEQVPQMNTGIYESEPWYEAYQQIVNKWTIIDNYGDFSYLKQFFGKDYSFDDYWLCDVNGNGVPELFLKSDYMGITAIFTYYDNEIRYLMNEVIEGINKETEEVIIYGHWHGAGGSGENEWKAYQITNNHAIYSLYIDYFDVEGLEKPYTIYTLDNQEYEKQENSEEYDALYKTHIEPMISIKNFTRYDLSDISGLNVIQ